MSAFEKSNDVDDLEREREVVPQTPLRGEMVNLSDDEKVKSNDDKLDCENEEAEKLTAADIIPSVEEGEEGKLLLCRVYKPQTIRLSRTCIQKQNKTMNTLLHTLMKTRTPTQLQCLHYLCPVRQDFEMVISS